MKTLSFTVWLVVATASAQGLPAEGVVVPLVCPEPAGEVRAESVLSDAPSAGSLVRLSASTAQASGSVEPRVRVTFNNKHITGRLVQTDADTLTILPDANRDTIVQIPRSSITRAAVSKGKRPWALAAFAGLGARVGAGAFSYLLGIGMCGDAFLLGTCSDSAIRTSRTIGFAIGSVAGVGVTHHLRREGWRTVPVGSLATHSGLAKP